MSDVTAQACREAADDCQRIAVYEASQLRYETCKDLVRAAELLLAAAEKLDIAQGSITAQSDFIRQMGREHEQQIAMLTVEFDKARAQVAKFYDEYQVMLAERDEARATLADLQRELDECRFTIHSLTDVPQEPR